MATEALGFYRHKKFLVDSQLTLQGGDVRLKGGITTNYPQTGDKIMPQGAVVVKETGDGLYYLASGADGASAGDINTVAQVDSAEAPDSDWKSKTITWTVTYPWGEIVTGTVTLGTGDDTVNEVRDALNADTHFANHLLAASNTIVEITTRQKGAVHLLVTSNLATAFGASGTEGEGTEADYRVITEQRSLVGVGGATRDSDPVPTLLAGHFDESELTGLTEEAKAVLQRRGSRFV